MTPIPLGILAAQISGSPFYVGAVTSSSNEVWSSSLINYSNGDYGLVSGERDTSLFITIPMMIRLGIDGTPIWKKRVSGLGDSYPLASGINSSGVVFSAGNTRFTVGNSRGGFIRWNADGSYASPAYQFAPTASGSCQGAGVDSSDNFYIYHTSGSGLRAITKFDSSLSIAWQRGFEGSLVKGRVRNDGVSLIIYSYVGSWGLFTVSATGTASSFPFMSSGYSASDVGFDGAGNFYLVGSNSGGQLIKFNSSLVFSERTQVGTTATTSFTRMIVGSDNSIYAFGPISGGAILVKFDSGMDVVWQRKISNLNVTDVAPDVTIANDGNVLVTGTSTINGRRSQVVCYLPSDGSILGSATISGTTFEVTASSEPVAVNQSSPMSSSYGLGFGADGNTWQTSTTTGIDSSLSVSVENI